MISDYTGTKAYRDELAKALDVARHRLKRRDFEGLSASVVPEIVRLDLELSKYQAVLFPRTPFPSWASLLVHGILEIGKQSPSIRFNSPSDANWTTRTQQLSYDLPANSVATYATGGA